MSRSIRCLAAAAVAAFLAAPALAQDYPSKPIRLIVPFAAGGPADLFARIYGPALATRLNTTVVVENRVGAGGVNGIDVVAKSAKDGYTIGLSGPGALVAAPFMMDKFPFDVLRDLQPVTMAALTPTCIVVANQTGIKSMKDLVAFAKANPGKISIASAGAGTLTHLAVELFKLDQGLNMVHVPYKGAAPAMVDLQAGRVQAMMPDFPAALPLARAGQITLFAVATAKRVASAPDIPTTAEVGFPEQVVDSVYGIVAPSGIPADSLRRLHAASVAVLEMPETKAAYAKAGADATSSTPEAYRDWIAKDQKRWERVVRAYNLKLE